MSSGWKGADVALLSNVYDLQCVSRMNALYYERRLSQLQNHSFWMEVVTAATASGSGLAALTLFATIPGRWAWQALALVAAVVAVVRPIYAPGKKIEAFTRQHQGYHGNFFALKKLAFEIRQDGSVTPDHRKRYDTLFDRHVQLSTEDEVTPDRKFLEEARRLAEKELPPGGFWWPDSALPEQGSEKDQQPPADIRQVRSLQKS
jgi:hypothetical protein